jgi:hypothetical protein
MKIGITAIIQALWRFALNAMSPQAIVKRIIFLMMMDCHIAMIAL